MIRVFCFFFFWWIPQGWGAFSFTLSVSTQWVKPPVFVLLSAAGHNSLALRHLTGISLDSFYFSRHRQNDLSRRALFSAPHPCLQWKHQPVRCVRALALSLLARVSHKTPSRAVGRGLLMESRVGWTKYDLLTCLGYSFSLRSCHFGKEPKLHLTGICLQFLFKLAEECCLWRMTSQCPFFGQLTQINKKGHLA